MEKKGSYNFKKRKAIVLIVSLSCAVCFPVLAGRGKAVEPAVIYVSSELFIPEEITRQADETEAASVEPLYHLQIYLGATHQTIQSVNGTLILPSGLSAITGLDNTPRNRQVNLSRAQTQWVLLSEGVGTPASAPFELRGLVQLPKYLRCTLQVEYLHAEIRQVSTQTLDFTITSIPTTIDILSVGNPPDSFKGTKITLPVTVKNTGMYSTVGAVQIHVKAESIKAGTNVFDLTSSDASFTRPKKRQSYPCERKITLTLILNI